MKTNTNKIVAIVGMCGAGKSQVADYLVERGYAYLRFGQVTLDLLKAQGLEINEVNEKKIREGLRREHGMGAYAKLNLSKINKMLNEGKSVVVDGLYSWSEYKVLKENYKDKLYVLAVYAPPKIRYERLSQRVHNKLKDDAVRFRMLTPEQAQARDYAEIENIEKGGPIVMADYTIINNADFKKMYKQIDEFLKLIS